jgi:hypothetical protein
MADIDSQRSIWIGEEDLGGDVVIKHKSKRYEVKIPPAIDPVRCTKALFVS